MNEGMIKSTFYLDNKIYKKLRIDGAKHERSISGQLREILNRKYKNE